MSKRRYTIESVERALTLHAAEGRIAGWERTAFLDAAGNKRPHWRIKLIDAPEGDIELTTLREAYVFVVGLASAAQAAKRADSTLTQFTTHHRDPAAFDHDLIHDVCGTRICTVEVNDSLACLALTAADHLGECPGEEAVA